MERGARDRRYCATRHAPIRQCGRKRRESGEEDEEGGKELLHVIGTRGARFRGNSAFVLSNCFHVVLSRHDVIQNLSPNDTERIYQSLSRGFVFY